MQDLIATVVSLFLIEPLQAEIGANLGAARMPQAAVAAGAACARRAAPVIVERAARDPWWAAASAVRLRAGGHRPRPRSSKPHPVVPPRPSARARCRRVRRREGRFDGRLSAHSRPADPRIPQHINDVSMKRWHDVAVQSLPQQELKWKNQAFERASVALIADRHVQHLIGFAWVP